MKFATFGEVISVRLGPILKGRFLSKYAFVKDVSLPMHLEKRNADDIVMSRNTFIIWNQLTSVTLTLIPSVA